MNALSQCTSTFFHKTSVMKASVTMHATLPSLRTIIHIPFMILAFLAELPKRFFMGLLHAFYVVLQHLIVAAFKPVRCTFFARHSVLTLTQPTPKSRKSIKYRGRIAVVGAGLTGISSAAHAISHGFDVVIYEKSDHVGKLAGLS
jgi:hypothetical protein